MNTVHLVKAYLKRDTSKLTKFEADGGVGVAFVTS